VIFKKGSVLTIKHVASKLQFGHACYICICFGALFVSFLYTTYISDSKKGFAGCIEKSKKIPSNF
jgi:hypothetical protein